MDESVLLDLLNLKPTMVHRITSTKKDTEMFIMVTLNPTQCTCPYCNGVKKTVKDYSNVKIRNALVLNEKCIIMLRKRRYKCLECGKTYVEENPFTSNRSSISYRTKIAIMNDLKDPNITYSFVAKRYNISTTEVIRIFDGFINYGRNKLPTNLCIDECYIAPNSQYSYACILYDYDTRKIVDVIKGRQKMTLMSYFSNIPQSERDEVKHVISDMWESYREVGKKYFRNCVYSCDSFHVVKEINTKLNNMRCRIMNKHKTNKSNYNISKSERKKAEKYYYLYKHFHKLLLSNYNNLELYEPRYNKMFNKKLDTNDLINLMLEDEPALAELYYLKEEYVRFNSDAEVTQENAGSQLDDIINNFKLAAIEFKNYDCFMQIANTLTNWREEIIYSFPEVIGGTRYHNGIAESCNAQIKKMIISANGITNFDRFRNRILYVMESSNKYTHVEKEPARRLNIIEIPRKK